MSRNWLRERGRFLWAKSATEGPGHSLFAHLLDVGLVAMELLERSDGFMLTVLADELVLDRAAARRLVVTLAALHDIGKATPVFQAKWPHGAPAEALAVKAEDLPHGRASGILLRSWLIDRGLTPRVASSLANAVAIHHGQRLPKNFASVDTYDPESVGEEREPWRTWQRALLDDVAEAFGPFPEVATKRYLRGRTWALLAGLTSIADWLGSSLSHTDVVSDPESFLARRRLQVVERLTAVGWVDERPWWRHPGVPDDFSAWFSVPERRFTPRPMQLSVAELLNGRTEPYLMVVEAPMGEGKTEAAQFSLVQPTGQNGAYIALPTQATSDAMHDRLLSFVARHEARSVDVALAHAASRSMVKLTSGGEEAHPEGLEARAQAESWFSQGRRELIAEIGVGTVDQALLAVLPTRHFFVRLWGLAGKTVVLDEVHAYDAYTSGLIAQLLRWLAALGTSVVLMSATLPKETRNQLVAAYCEGYGFDPPVLPDTTYPRATLVSRSEVSNRTFVASRSGTVLLADAPYQTDELGAQLLAAAESGAAVAAVVNDVGRAQELYLRCLGKAENVTLLHARMPLLERKRRERDVLTRYGPRSGPGSRGGLVIATQVLEQSLDLDFDVMFTDLAPMDLILQRLGRLHRHMRPARPGPYREPMLRIAGLLSPGVTRPVLEAIDSVYDRLLMWRTWALLAHRKQIDLPNDIDPFVQLVYSTDPIGLLLEFAQEVTEAEAESAAKVQSMAAAAHHWALAAPNTPATDSWGEAGRDADDWRSYALRVPTRLGTDTVSVVPLMVHGSLVEVVGTGVSRLRGDDSRAENRFVEAAVGQQIRVGRKSLVARLRAATVPGWWRRSGGLRYLHPLFLDEDAISVVDRGVRLDRALGLVYERRREA